MKKYRLWELIVAAMLPLFIVVLWLMNIYATDGGTVAIVSRVISVSILCIAFYAYYCMYRGAKATGRFPRLVLAMLVLMVLYRLFTFVTVLVPVGGGNAIILALLTGVPYLAYLIVAVIVDIKLYKAGVTVLAVALTCTLALPVISTVVSMGYGYATASLAPDIVARIIAILSSFAHAVIFLHRNDLYVAGKE